MEATLTPGGRIFDSEQVERARRYHRPLYRVRVFGIVLSLAVLALLSFTRVGDWLLELVDWLPWWGEAPAFAGVVVVAGSLVATPLAYWRYVHERRWGFSTQTVRGWATDRAKGLGIGLVLTALPMLGLLAAVRIFPSWWPLAAAAGAAVIVLVVNFLAPVVLEPGFNKFEPLPDERLADQLRELAERAGVPVRDVLVADASRRTRKHNAYVSGLGKTRRVVVWDTLLEAMPAAGLRIVVAHELGHRRFRHVAWGTALEMAGAAGSVLVLWAGLKAAWLRDALEVSRAGDPGVVPFAIFLFTLLDLAALPFGATLSRRFERTADRFSLELTGDADAYESTHLVLARENLADLDPPRLYHLALHGHPTAPARIAAGRAWKRAHPK